MAFVYFPIQLRAVIRGAELWDGRYRFWDLSLLGWGKGAGEDWDEEPAGLGTFRSGPSLCWANAKEVFGWSAGSRADMRLIAGASLL